MRLFFIPGFGEEAWIFDKIAPHLPGEQVFINNWELLGNMMLPALTPPVYAQKLISDFGIKQEDVIIGHSMGGWVAYHIKQLVHCPVIQLASWTDDHKLVKVISNDALVYWCVRKGLIFNRGVLHYLLRNNYCNKASAAVFRAVFEKLISANREAVVNQLRLVRATHKRVMEIEPDLRIHASADTIVKFPDQSVCEVPGDHFSLWTHPEEVYKPIADFLQQRDITKKDRATDNVKIKPDEKLP